MGTEGWTGQRKELTCNAFTPERRTFCLMGTFRSGMTLWTQLSQGWGFILHINPSLARSHPLGRCSSLGLRAGPTEEFISAAISSSSQSCWSVGPGKVVWAELHTSPRKDSPYIMRKRLTNHKSLAHAPCKHTP